MKEEKKLDIDEMAKDMVDDYYTDNGRFAMPLVTIAVLLLIGTIIFFIMKTPEEVVNNPVTPDDIVTSTEDEVVAKECIESIISEACIKASIDEKDYYVDKQLLELGFSKVEYLDEDLPSDSKITPSKLEDMEKTFNLEVKSNSSSPYKFLTITLKDKNIDLKVLSKDGKELNSQKIENIESMFVHKNGYYEEVIIVSVDNQISELSVDTREYSIDKATKANDYKNYNFSDVGYYEVDKLYVLDCYKTYEKGDSTYRYVVKTINDNYYYLDNNKEYSIDTFVVFSENLSILKDRRVDVGTILNDKANLLITSNLKPEYVISSDGYLFNSKYEQQSKSKVKGVFKKSSKDNLDFIIILLEDGTNIYVNGLV